MFDILLLLYTLFLHPQKTIDDVRDIDFKVKELTNIRAQREECFKNKFGDDASVALTVRDWAVRNRNQLSGPVAGPVGLEVRAVAVSRGGGGKGCFSSEHLTAVASWEPRWVEIQALL